MPGAQQGFLKEGRSQLALKDFPSPRRGWVGGYQRGAGRTETRAPLLPHARAAFG